MTYGSRVKERKNCMPLKVSSVSSTSKAEMYTLFFPICPHHTLGASERTV